jgi:hypothetical protein
MSMKNETTALIFLAVLLATHRVYFEANVMSPDMVIKWESEKSHFAIDREPYAELLESSLTASHRVLTSFHLVGD